jgi:putative ABC transport system permease protein
MVPVRYNLRSLMVRKATTAATSLGIAMVVAVLCVAQMLSNGVKKTLSHAGRENVALVLRKGSDNELGSGIDDPQVGLITSQAQVKNEAGKPCRAAEVVVVAATEKIGAAGITNLQIRGVEADVFKFRPTVKIIDGRMPAPGSDEAVIGKRVRGRFKGMEIGQSFEVKKNRAMSVVGVFEDDGSASESEVWVDVDALRAAFGREGYRSSVRVELTSPAAFDAFKANIEGDKRLGLQALRETDYFEKQSEGTSIFVSALGIMITVFFSIGATIGAAITMYAAVANRTREVGILRALGFSRSAIMFSFVFESVVLAMLGGVVGVAMALCASGYKISMLNFASWSEVVFSFEATPKILIGGLLFSLFMGLFGGFLPALRASRVSPVAAMRG